MPCSPPHRNDSKDREIDQLFNALCEFECLTIDFRLQQDKLIIFLYFEFVDKLLLAEAAACEQKSLFGKILYGLNFRTMKVEIT